MLILNVGTSDFIFLILISFSLCSLYLMPLHLKFTSLQRLRITIKNVRASVCSSSSLLCHPSPSSNYVSSIYVPPLSEQSKNSASSISYHNEEMKSSSLARLMKNRLPVVPHPSCTIELSHNWCLFVCWLLNVPATC